ncbi:MAG: D-2-hydroxyacid dehydrogenase [Deltaproteobacteria bacterium]|jgi:glycerate dehydrogenase|nr:D-2-hydroxyacid dehydrogenase [Deltaproteobacteria bacterium]
MKIVILDGYAENPGDLSWAGIEALGDLTIHDRTPVEKVAETIGNAEIVLSNKAQVRADAMAKCPNLKYIGVLSTGYDCIDVKAAADRGVIVTNIPTYGTTAVAQFAIALLMEIAYRVGHHAKAVASGRWERSPDWSFWDYPLIELDGKTIGLIGFGRIGQATGKVANALGMEVLAFDDHQSDEGRAIARYASLDELLPQSDVVSLHCPLLPETRGIINKTTIAKMKDGAILINNSRGPLIVEEDLAAALNSGKLYAAGLDVVNQEPIRGDNPLLKAKNCLITPHISWAPRESRQRLMELATENIKAFLDGKPKNVVSS